MFIRDYMTPNPLTIQPETPVEDIANLFSFTVSMAFR